MIPDSENPLGAAAEATNELPANSARGRRKLVVLLFFVIVAGSLFWLSRQYLNLDFLAEIESKIKSYYLANPVIVFAAAFAIYVLVTGFSIPGATVMSLIYAWFFGFWKALVLVSFASTAGATMAFLLSRYLFRDWIQSRFGDRLKTFNESLDRDGPFYLFTLRLVPVFPFFAINAVMGLTRLPAVTFWWVSQIGMLAGTAVYVYAGSRIPDLQTLDELGIKAIFTPSQLTQITIAFVLLGTFPLIVKKTVDYFFKIPKK